MWRLIIGLLFGFGAGWLASRYVRQFQSDDMLDDLMGTEQQAALLEPDELQDMPALIELGSIRATMTPRDEAELESSDDESLARQEMAEAVTTVLAESEQADSAAEVNLLEDVDTADMIIERDEDGTLVITLETDPGLNGSEGDELGELVAEAEPEPFVEIVSGGDDLMRIRGIGQSYRERLYSAGISSFAQIAALTPEELSERTGIPVDRIIRESFIQQAQALANEEV